MMSLERYYGVKPPHFIQEEDPVVSGVRQNGGYDTEKEYLCKKRS